MNCVQFSICILAIFAVCHADITRSRRRLEGEGIVGGDEARNGQIPYHVYLKVCGSHYCGGSILSERFVLTAAHCVVNDDGSFVIDPMEVVAGTNDLQSTLKSRVDARVVQVFVPKAYYASSQRKLRDGDIAVVKLNKDLGLARNSNLAYVKLPGKDNDYSGVSATTSGFGYTSIGTEIDRETGKIVESNGVATSNLRYATATVLKNQDCQKYYGKHINGNHMCASLVQRNKNKPEGLCHGDSGGPLVYRGIQIGVVSVSPFACREDIKPAVYTRLSSYLDFINKVLHGKTDNSFVSATLKVTTCSIRTFKNQLRD